MADQTVPQPELIDANGNLNVHGREGVVLPINFTDEQDPPQPRDASADVLYFEVDGLFRVPLLPAPAGSGSDIRLLVLTQAEIDLITSSIKFVLRDETPGLPPDVCWEGTIKRRGFTDTPPAPVG